MKKSLLTLISIIVGAFCIAQKDSIETLRQKLALKSTDSLKIRWMLDLGSQYLFVKPDSAIYYYRMALALADKNGFEKQVLDCNQRIARFMQDNGNYTEALRLSNQSIKQAQELKDTIKMWYSVRQILWIFMGLGDDKAVEYSDQLLSLTRSAAINRLPDAAGFNEMANRYKANVFENIHQDDSAFFYYSLALNFAKKAKDPLYVGLSTENIGQFYFHKEKYDSAFYYYRLSIPIAIQNLRTDIKMRCQIDMANIFLNKTELDSALVYANIVFKDAASLPDSAMMENASYLLSTIYDKQGKIDSAYKYLEYGVKLKDLLSEQKQEKNAREMLFRETLQQQQKEQERSQSEQKYKSNIKIYSLAGGIAVLLLLAFMFYRNSKQKQKDAIKIQKAYNELKTTQSQLIQSEKMASLGELTAGIAHEIQNPLNFVNNFSEVSNELVDEMNVELDKGDIKEAKIIATDIKQNLEKINHHGKRADAIVKGMLQHSRSSSGQKEPTDINALCDEYLRLSYHGLRAKDKSFNATMKTDFDSTIEKINVIPQDIGRVVLNLINNAFYAVQERQKAEGVGFNPIVSVITKKVDGKVEIHVRDNGNGIPQKILDKIFQPFFTTKPTGQGTGLGLSLSYDIVKAHGGEIKVETKEGEGTEFIIQLPVV